MSEEYKQYIDKLCKDADEGNTKAAKELLDEANKWFAKIKEIKEKDKNKNND